MKTEPGKRTRTFLGAVGTGLLAVTALAAPPPPAGTPPVGPQWGNPQSIQPGMPSAPLKKGAYLGVAVSPVEPALRAQLDLPDGTGLTVAFVDPKGPSKDVLRPYDILTKLNDQILVNAEQLAVLVRMHKPAQEITLEFRRGGKNRTVSVKLGEKKLPPLASTFRGPRVIPMPMPGFGGLPGRNGMGGQAPRFGSRQGPGAFQPGPGGPGERQPGHAPAPPVPGRVGMPQQAPAAPGAGPPASGGPMPPPGNNVPMRTTTTSSAATFSVAMNGRRATAVSDPVNGLRLVCINPDGTVVFNGPINTPEQRRKVPAEFQELLDKIEKDRQRFQFKPQPVPSPAPNL